LADQQIADKAPVKHRRYIKNYIIDKDLQLRYIGAVTLISAAISSLLGYLIWIQRSEASQTIIQSVNATDWVDPGLRSEIISQLHGSDIFVVLRMAGVCVGLIVVLSMFLIVMTHKVAGPLYKIGMHFDQIKDGKLPVMRDLRRGDEFQDFFKKFKGMIETLRVRTQADVEALDTFLRACDAAGASGQGELGHGLDELKKLKKEKESSLEK
jgi:methyl-accepting chemotaxis protein